MNSRPNTPAAKLQLSPPPVTPTTANARSESMQRAAPAVWKLWLLRWMGLYPTLLLLYLLLGPIVNTWPVPFRVLLMSGLGTWFLSFVLMPKLTRWFAGWLHRSASASDSLGQ